MNKIRRSNDLTPTQAEFLDLKPWFVYGVCDCGKPATAKTYGLRAELEDCKLKCKECDK